MEIERAQKNLSRLNADVDANAEDEVSRTAPLFFQIKQNTVRGSKQ